MNKEVTILFKIDGYKKNVIINKQLMKITPEALKFLVLSNDKFLSSK